MNHQIKIIFLFALLLTILFCSNEPQKSDIKKAEIEKVIDASIGWAMTKNIDLLYSSVAQDSSFFIYHPDSKSTIIGFEAFTKLSPFWMSPDFKSNHYKIWDLRINLSQSGDVGWYSCMLEDCSEFKGEPGCWEDTRWTGVLEKRDGKWVIVQMHFSFAADKVLAELEVKK
jgi:hypothetical protein